MKITITKKQIIEAINNEPLSNGLFVPFIPNPKCTVCAVGAVLRTAGLHNQAIHDIGDRLIGTGDCGTDSDYRKYLAKKKYMLALSSKFETLAYQNEDMGFVRTKLTAFVNRNFPAKFTFDTEKV